MRKALYILGILEDTDVEWLSQHGAVHSASAGSYLIKEGQPIDHLYILLEGELSVRVGSKDVEVATLLPGEIVGEIAFVTSRLPTASVLVKQPSHLLTLHRDTLSTKLQRDTAFSSRFYRAIALFLADRLHVTTGRFGYGDHQQDVDVDLIDDAAMDDISLAAVRFDKLLKLVRGDYRARGAAVANSSSSAATASLQ
jgi:CRP/FNR family transcriptional regulator, cyclic AMP receptor protein